MNLGREFLSASDSTLMTSWPQRYESAALNHYLNPPLEAIICTLKPGSTMLLPCPPAGSISEGFLSHEGTELAAGNLLSEPPYRFDPLSASARFAKPQSHLSCSPTLPASTLKRDVFSPPLSPILTTSFAPTNGAESAAVNPLPEPAYSLNPLTASTDFPNPLSPFCSPTHLRSTSKTILLPPHPAPLRMISRLQQSH
jgi:hypothetical protein